MSEPGLIAISLFFIFRISVSFAARDISQEKNQTLCERYGEGLERKFAANPHLLLSDLDELIVRVGSLGPDRVNHHKSGRMLASIASAKTPEKTKQRVESKEASALAIRAHKKLTEANRVLTQSKRRGFFDEDEERASGIQNACAKAIYWKASILERMLRPD